MFNEEDKRKAAAARTWRLIKEISAACGKQPSHKSCQRPGEKRPARDSKCECARVCIWGMKCVIKQRSEYVINRYVINPPGEKKKKD